MKEQINNDFNKGGENGNGFTINFKGDKYKLVANVDVQVLTEKEAFKQMGYTIDESGNPKYVGNHNKDYENNYVRVEDLGDSPSAMANNNGLFNVARDFANGFTTATHEFLHSLGIEYHSNDSDDPNDTGPNVSYYSDGRPDMMVAHSTRVLAKYGTGKLIDGKYKIADLNQRIIKVKNINDVLKINSVKKPHSIYNIGGVTNFFYNKKGKKLN